MDLQALKAELDADPALAAMTPAEAAAALNAPVEALAPRAVTKRTIYSTLGLTRGVAILQALRSRSVGNPILAEVVALLDDLSGGGVDIAHPESRAMVDQLAADGVLTAGEATQIKALGLSPTTRAASLGLGPVTPGDVERARAIE